MKLLFYSNMGLGPLHFGTELELIEIAKKENNDIYVLKCDTGLESCFFNPCHNLLGCSICTARTDTFHSKIGIDPAKTFTIKKLFDKENYTIPTFNSLEDLFEFEYKGTKIGRGIASSVISLERDYGIFNNDKRETLIKTQTKMAINALLNFQYYLEQIKPDMVYLFNGRFAGQYPLLKYCIQHKIPFRTYESGSSTNKYEIFENSLPHDLETRNNAMHQIWAEGSTDKKQIAENWYITKRKGTNEKAINFLKEQQKGAMPAGFDSSKRNIGIFNSSEDEVKALGDWENNIYKNQNDAIQVILKHFEQTHPDFHFYLRMHPNLSKVDNIQTQELYQLQAPNLTLIKPQEKIDSFAIVESCEKILTFGSTVGIESTFWGKPSILLGKSFYQSLDCVYAPKNYTELYELLLKKNLSPKLKTSTYKFAYYWTTFGLPYSYFKYDGKFNSSFKGQKLKRVTAKTILKSIYTLPQFNLWRKLNQVILGRPLNFKDLFQLKSHTHN